MKKCILSFTFLAHCLYSQTTQVVNSSGGTLADNETSIEYSIGEVVATNMFTANQYTVTIGLLQPQSQDVITITASEVELKTVDVFPNPTSGTVSIMGLGSQTVTLYNAWGTEIKLLLRNEMLDMSALPSGMYTLQTINVGTQLLNTVKIIKE